MARTCKVCSHPKRKEIEAAVTNGESQVSIAKRFGVTNVNVSRHKSGHMRAPPSHRIRRPEEGKAETSLDRVEQMYADTRGVLDEALANGYGEASLRAVKELRQTVELLAKLKGELSDRPAVQFNLVQSSEWHQVRDVVFQVLQRYPGAVEELSGRLLELEAR